MAKLGIIVPYRNRHEHLAVFNRTISKYLNNTDIDYKIIIVQQDDAKLFNRGMLLNIGFTFAKKYHCDYVVFHDIDMIPLEVDYTYSPNPIHLATDFEVETTEKMRESFDTYFGGVTMFSVEDFEKIDGYSNKYWGWGFEDDDLFLRCKNENIGIQTTELKNIVNNKSVLKFNGVDAYVKSKNPINFSEDFSITICFEPNDIKLDHTKQSDEFTIFSIPGYDFAISYTSFNRYNFCVFDSTRKAIYLNSEILPTYRTNITLTYDSASTTIKMYQDAKFIGETTEIRRFYPTYRKEEFMYLGVGNPNREIIPNWFKGYFEYFAYYDRILTDTEIQSIVESKTNIPTDNLQLHYDSEFIDNYHLTDLSNNDNNGKIIKCEIVKTETNPYTIIQIPHRRKSLFKSLKHEENGFVGNGWKSEVTRWNQLRFTNEVTENLELLKNDGLSTLQFVVHGIEKIDKHIEIVNVGI